MRNIYEEIKEYVDRGFRIDIEFINNEIISWSIWYHYNRNDHSWKFIINGKYNNKDYPNDINVGQALDQIHHAMVRLPLSGE